MLYTLLVFSCRRFAHFIVTLPWFDRIIIFVICASSISLALEDPVSYDSPLNDILSFADYVFTAIFTLEMLLKVNVTQGKCYSR